MSLTYSPGPVTVAPDAQVAMGGEPRAHRGEWYAEALAGVKSRLCALAGASACEVMVGSGTLANDVVAGQLKLLGEPGIIISQGEFGARLVDHARRWGLPHSVEYVPEGKAIDYCALARPPETTGGYGWLWAVHCETSTGVLNDPDTLKAFCAKYKMKLALDCMSSIGAVPVDLSGVWIASASSGKGLTGYPGLGIVLYNYEPEPAPWTLPRYLDLGLWAKRRGVPFTGSSNLLFALCAALRETDWPRRFEAINGIGARLRVALDKRRISVVAEAGACATHVVTLRIPDGLASVDVGRELAGRGYKLSFESPHQIAHNWIQIGVSGADPDAYDNIEGLTGAIALCLSEKKRSVA